MAWHPRLIPAKEFSYPARAALAGGAIVAVCVISLLAAWVNGSVAAMLHTYSAALNSDARNAVIVLMAIAAAAAVILVGSAIWAFWKQGLKPWGWYGEEQG